MLAGIGAQAYQAGLRWAFIVLFTQQRTRIVAAAVNPQRSPGNCDREHPVLHRGVERVRAEPLPH